MRKFLVSMSFIIALCGTAASGQDMATVKFQPSAYRGFVLSAEYPKSWKTSVDVQEFWLSTWANSPDIRSASFHLGIRVFEKPISFDWWVTQAEWMLQEGASVNIYDRGYNQALDANTLFFTWSNKTLNNQPATSPTAKNYVALVHDRVVLQYSLSAGDPAQYEAALPAFERILKSVKVTPADAFKTGEISRYYNAPSLVISKRRDYYLDAGFSIQLPSGWVADEAVVREADETGRGRLSVFLSPVSPDGSGRFERLLVNLEGLPVTGLQRAEFLATAEPLLDTLMTSRRRIETSKPAPAPSDDEAFGFCLQRRKMRHGEGTGNFDIVTYEGQDESGRNINARIITAGGLTVACHVVYLADPETFQQSHNRVDALLKTLKLELFSPALHVR